MYRFESTEIKMLAFIAEAFYPLFLWKVCNFRTMNNRRSYGSPKDQNLFIIKAENLWTQYWSHREKEKHYQISWKINIY